MKIFLYNTYNSKIYIVQEGGFKMRKLKVKEINEVRKMCDAEIYGWLSANRHLFSFKAEGRTLQAFQDDNFIASCDIPFPKGECQKYTIQSFLSDEEIPMEIPCIAKINDVLWYCPLKSVDETDLNSPYYFDKEDICQVIIDGFSGTSDMTICYYGKDIRGNSVSGMQSLFHKTYQEMLDFIEAANASGNVCEFFHNYQTDFDENRKNKNRFPYILTCNYKINQKITDKRHNGVIARILFSFCSQEFSSSIQYYAEVFDEDDNKVVITPDDMLELRNNHWFLNGEKSVRRIVYSDNITFVDFRFVYNN